MTEQPREIRPRSDRDHPVSVRRRATGPAAAIGCLLALVGVAVPALTRSAIARDGHDAPAGDRTATPRELGLVRWERDFDAALAAARAKDLPVLVLFDEIPGCANCVGFGKTVLSHPLIVDAAQSLFVPVAVYNNRDGDDRRVLESFNEPAWNNPVVRVIDAQRRPLAPRLADDPSVAGLANTMTRALTQAGRPAPAWLTLLASESAARSEARTQTAVFGMFCFWEGEAKLGAIDGVCDTVAGFLDGSEVVQVTFDPTVVSYQSLLASARQMQCATRVFTRSDEQQRLARAVAGDAARRTDEPVRVSARDTKYQIRRTPWAHVPMTPAQASRVNAAVGFGERPDAWLSPSQLELARRVNASPSLAWPETIDRTDVIAAWAQVQAVAAKAP